MSNAVYGCQQAVGAKKRYTRVNKLPLGMTPSSVSHRVPTARVCPPIPHTWQVCVTSSEASMSPENNEHSLCCVIPSIVDTSVSLLFSSGNNVVNTLYKTRA